MENLEYEIRGDNRNTKALQTNYLKLTELKTVLQKTDALFDEVFFPLNLVILLIKIFKSLD